MRLGPAKQAILDLRFEPGHRQAVRECDAACEAQRDVVCRTRQFMNSVTGGKGNVYLGVRGPTPRTAEKSAAWGWIIINGLRQSDLPPEARALAAAFADELEELTRVAVGAGAG